VSNLKYVVIACGASSSQFFLSYLIFMQISPPNSFIWQASEASETLLGVNNGNQISIYIYYVRPHFCSAGTELRKMGGD